MPEGSLFMQHLPTSSIPKQVQERFPAARPFLLQLLRRPLTRLRCSDGQAEKNCIKSSSEASLWPPYTSDISTKSSQ